MSIQGSRKVVTCAMGLAALLVLASLSSFGHLPNDGLDTLSWSVVFLTGSALGANVGEHAFKKVPGASVPPPPTETAG